mmetsp:Transcript_11302/g.16547  ORF Transcript_11302/g.16547 Transcript_11302/m.16547 type:complete len:109 (-) Transcript_11302:259-585(-)
MKSIQKIVASGPIMKREVPLGFPVALRRCSSPEECSRICTDLFDLLEVLANMTPVHQSMMDLHRKRHHGLLPSIEEFSPGDSGNAVMWMKVHRMLISCKAHPRNHAQE